MTAKVGIIGLGLMGGSLGLALKKYLPEIERLGRDVDDENESYALSSGIIEQRLTTSKVHQLDYIFLAVPVKSTVKALKSISQNINKKHTVVTDMGSTKEYICKTVEKEFPNIKFVGGHPLAGGEKSGPRFARADLFKNKNYIITADIQKNQEDNNSAAGSKKESKAEETSLNEMFLSPEVNKLTSLLTSLGCSISYYTPKEHDHMVALTSHLPHLAAFSLLVQYIEQENSSPQGSLTDGVGTGFLDFTRIGASSPEMWLDIFFTNRENIIKKIDDYIKIMENCQSFISDNKQQKIREIMNLAGKKRSDIEKEIADEN